MKKTIGGDRLGSGAKMQTSLHDYGRCTHNLSSIFRSSMACGLLYPCYVNVGLNGDTFEINTDALVRTIPTQAPLFGSFKLQVDYFLVPMRLYNSTLHNNPINVGMRMQEIDMPFLTLTHNFGFDDTFAADDDNKQISPSSLLKYLGLSGIANKDPEDSVSDVQRDFEMIPLCAYFDIFKNYYSNKQEERFPVVTSHSRLITATINSISLLYLDSNSQQQSIVMSSGVNTNFDSTLSGFSIVTFMINGHSHENVNDILKMISFDYGISPDIETKSLFQYKDEGGYVEINKLFDQFSIKVHYLVDGSSTYRFMIKRLNIETSDIGFSMFQLEDVDNMREKILQFEGGVCLNDSSLGVPLFQRLYPFDHDRPCQSRYALYGLVPKTYQSDIFNNWLRDDVVTNLIRSVTTIDTSNGLTMDALNLAQKVYNMLNRIAVSGGTYYDWQEAVYGQKVIKQAETPIYCGGMSSEVVFEEVVSTADTDISGDLNKLGTLAGKGTLHGKKGGHVIIKVKEPSFIMAIASLTPRLDYTQGNAWYLTELKTFDDLRKPELDQIGFQPLIGEQMHWRDTYVDPVTSKPIQRSPGQVPAWINYMTDVNHAYGDFAERNKAQYMILSRDYSTGINGIIDVTTYIDPRKFNQAFAYTDLDAQNFWVQIKHDIIARRVGSGKIIPNL